MNGKRLRGVIAVLSAAALLLAACGGDDATETEPGAETATDTDPAEGDEAGAEEDADAGGEIPEDNPLAGEQITLTVGVGPGGGYDAYVRLIAPYLEEQLGATVVINNEPGAGGLVALNNLLASPPDGTQVMLINGSGIAGSALAEAEGVNFELEDLTYLARVYAGPKLIGSGPDSGYETLEDLENADDPFLFGASGPGASTYVEALLVMEILGYPYEIVTGYDGSSDVLAAMLVGEVDGIIVDLDTLGPTVDEGDAIPILLTGTEERSDQVPDTPILRELDLDSEQQELVDAFEALLDLGRSLVAHPDTPDELVQTLRTAFDNILTDPDFVEDAESQGRPIGYVDAAGVEDLVDTITQAPERFRELVSLGF
ncbi:Bug family tripartite tricarboxylate transporter substrate binding protein [Egicoccus sp. AB-alg2]|uniref:Bug family tripartite tricarboxylate transporter substrate binding protein n=1 Tax=Egicoccus sp. AB-alg2 TaxID=3242693 RepID=UPI00359D1DE1